MLNVAPAIVLASFTVAEFKAFKRAVRVLCMAGMSYDVAVDMLLRVRAERDEQRRERRFSA